MPLQVVVGSVVIRCPTIALAQSAFGELELSIELFKQATEHPVVKHGLVSMLLVFVQLIG